MKKHELGDWLSLRGFPLGAKQSSIYISIIYIHCKKEFIVGLLANPG